MIEDFLKKVCFFMPFSLPRGLLRYQEKLVLSLKLIYFSKEQYFLLVEVWSKSKAIGLQKCSKIF